MGGSSLVMQIDESLFQGKRKHNNRGRLRFGDHKPEENSDEDEDEVINT